MTHRPPVLLPVALMFLLAPVLSLWVRSHETTEEWALLVTRRYAITSANGTLSVEVGSKARLPSTGPQPTWARSPTETDIPFSATHRTTYRRDFAGRWLPNETAFGFGRATWMGWASNSFGGGSVYTIERRRLYVIPYWSVALAAAAPAVVLVAHLRRAARARAAAGAPHPVCAACGYDLRATPDRCPECGAVPAAAA